jgi:uncharacterized protein YggE
LRQKDNGIMMQELIHLLLTKDAEQDARNAAVRDEAAALAEAREEKLMQLVTMVVDSRDHSPSCFVLNKSLVSYPPFSGENGHPRLCAQI